MTGVHNRSPKERMHALLTFAASLSDAQNAPARELPVDTWQPTHCGEIDIEIRQDGTWWHFGTPIARPALVLLFARVLRHDPDGYVLVTPAEKLSIRVADVPFLIVDVTVDAGIIRLRTNLGDSVTVDADHGLQMRPGPDGVSVPYVRVRGKLDARFSRSAWFQLADLAMMNADGVLQVSSGPHIFQLGTAE